MIFHKFRIKPTHECLDMWRYKECRRIKKNDFESRFGSNVQTHLADQATKYTFSSSK